MCRVGTKVHVPGITAPLAQPQRSYPKMYFVFSSPLGFSWFVKQQATGNRHESYVSGSCSGGGRRRRGKGEEGLSKLFNRHFLLKMLSTYSYKYYMFFQVCLNSPSGFIENSLTKISILSVKVL